MGYIMPVENFQYQQYHNRVVKKERDPYPIEKLYPIQFGVQYQQEMGKEEEPNTADSNHEVDTSQTQKKNQQRVIHQSYASITGAGGNFRTQV